MSLIQTIDISKVFSAGEVETNALNGVSLSIEKGEFVAIMGPSGCGKTTLLNILGMLDTPSGGTYIFQGQDITFLSERQRAAIRKHNIGFVFQNFNLIDELTVFENVELPLVYQGVPSKARKERVMQVLGELQIAHKHSLFPPQLSGGQQQRVAVARAMAGNPMLLLADEPTGNLDSMNGEEVMNLLEQLNESGTTIVMVTHSQRDADYARRLVRLFDGKVINEHFRKTPA
ncbi:MAG TPA: ABC transporter ATP-binding protein [Bacteroidales bacterium]|nr:ABC transporter ATP-binding protein [Bacteroidales bacterium]